LRQPWVKAIYIFNQPCKGFSLSEPFQGLTPDFQLIPGLSLTLQPWAGISQRLRRYVLSFK
jgi:hypothetical protein